MGAAPIALGVIFVVIALEPLYVYVSEPSFNVNEFLTEFAAPPGDEDPLRY